MRKQQKQKIMAIVALCISVLGLTLGFAAFSNTLTISSSAKVSPDESDFNIKVYGAINSNHLVGEVTSSTSSVPTITGAASAKPAKISTNGKTITLSDISAEMTAPGEQVTYIFRVKNEGQYDAYLNYYDIEHLLYGITSECTAGENTTASLVEEACEYIGMRLIIGDENGNILNFENQEIKLEKNKEIYLQIEILYNDNISLENSTPRADGDFSIDFEDITLEFSTVPLQS